MVDFAGGHPTTEEAAEVIAALDAELGRAPGEIEFHPGVQYRHIVVAPDGWADAECTPPHDLTDKPVVLAHGPGGAEAAARSWRPVADDRRRFDAVAANQVWLWGQGHQPVDDAVPRAATACRRGWCTAVDLVRGLGVLTDMDVVDVAGATGWYDTELRGQARRGARTRSPTAPTCSSIHVEATDEAGHAGNVEEKVKALENWDRRILAGLVEGLDALGPWRLLLLPDHATPLRPRRPTRATRCRTCWSTAGDRRAPAAPTPRPASPTAPSSPATSSSPASSSQPGVADPRVIGQT